jgi:hypothetical protein
MALGGLNLTARDFAKIGELYQTQWIHGDGGFRLFRPLLHSHKSDTLLLLERYERLAVWAVAETAAQTSPLWMSAILANQDNQQTWLGEAYQMLDDALDFPRELKVD